MQQGIRIMKITSAVYVKGITGSDPILHDGKFHVVFMGRSNVGKSTLINSLTRMPSLSRTSSTPGKTMHMDFSLLTNNFIFSISLGMGTPDARRWNERN